MRRTAILGAATGALLACAAGDARAANFAVNSISDAPAAGSTADGVCDTGATVGSADECTLRAAIQESNSTPGDDTIDLRGATGTVLLASALPSVAANVVMTGPGADRLTVRRPPASGSIRLLTIVPTIDVTVSGLTLADGLAPDGEGGAITQGPGSSLTLDGVVVSGSRAEGINPSGGAIYDNGGALTIRNSTLSGNVANGTGVGGASGSAVAVTPGAGSSLTIANSTISANRVDGIGASTSAVLTFAPTDLLSVTFAGNTVEDVPATATADLAVVAAAATVRNTIFESTGSPNCAVASGGSITSGGNNLQRGTSCSLGAAGDLSNTDPLLGGLAANGGPTPTHAPQPGSPAIDAGVSGGLTTDQRGLKRPVDLRTAGPADPADIGAVEVQGQLDPIPGSPSPGAAPPFPAKLEVLRARVLKSSRQLDVLAPITARASGNVLVRFQAAGRTISFTAPVSAGRVSFRRKLSAAQAAKGTGILTLRYRGDADTQPQEVRLRAASVKASLKAGRPRIVGTRLTASGTISSRARGVVRVQLLYEPPGQNTVTFAAKATIRSGPYRLNVALPQAVRDAIAQRRGVVHSYTLFTGSLAARMRGEMASFEVLGRR